MGNCACESVYGAGSWAAASVTINLYQVQSQKQTRDGNIIKLRHNRGLHSVFWCTQSKLNAPRRHAKASAAPQSLWTVLQDQLQCNNAKALPQVPSNKCDTPSSPSGFLTVQTKANGWWTVLRLPRLPCCTSFWHFDTVACLSHFYLTRAHMPKVVHSQHFKEQQQPDATRAKFVFEQMENMVPALQTRRQKCDSDGGKKSWQTLLFCSQEEPHAVSASIRGILMSSHHKPHHKPTHSRFMEAGDEIRNEGYYFRVCILFHHDLFSSAKYWSQSFLETKLLSFALGGFSMCLYLLCSQIFWLCFLLLQHSQQQIPPIWAAAVIGLSHILLHQSLNMTTGWWWFQRLRVMTALSPSLWSHFAICLFSPFPFFPLLFWAPSSEYNSIILRISA